MVFIIKSEQPASSALARASYDRQVDVYKLARMGNRDSARMWNTFASENPAMARVITADVATESSEVVKANTEVDKRLRKAERLVTKGKVKPVRSTQDVKVIEHVLTAGDIRNLAAKAFINSANPADREAARGLL